MGGAATFGALLAGGGALLGWRDFALRNPEAVFLCFGLLSLLYSTREFSLVPLPMPKPRLQVPANWRYTLSRESSAFWYGFGLGVGLGTRIPVSTFYIVILWILVCGDPVQGIPIMAAFGFGRALPLLWMNKNLNSPKEYVWLADTLAGCKCVVNIVNGLALGFAGTVLIAIGMSV